MITLEHIIKLIMSGKSLDEMNIPTTGKGKFKGSQFAGAPAKTTTPKIRPGHNEAAEKAANARNTQKAKTSETMNEEELIEFRAANDTEIEKAVKQATPEVTKKIMPAAAQKAASSVAGKAIGGILKAAGPVAATIGAVMEPTPAGEKMSEFQRQEMLKKYNPYKAQGRSIKDYEAQLGLDKPVPTAPKMPVTIPATVTPTKTEPELPKVAPPVVKPTTPATVTPTKTEPEVKPENKPKTEPETKTEVKPKVATSTSTKTDVDTATKPETKTQPAELGAAAKTAAAVATATALTSKSRNRSRLPYFDGTGGSPMTSFYHDDRRPVPRDVNIARKHRVHEASEGTEKRMKEPNVGRPDTPASKRLLRKQGEIKTKFIDEAAKKNAGIIKSVKKEKAVEMGKTIEYPQVIVNPPMKQPNPEDYK